MTSESDGRHAAGGRSRAGRDHETASQPRSRLSDQPCAGGSTALPRIWQRLFARVRSAPQRRPASHRRHRALRRARGGAARRGAGPAGARARVPRRPGLVTARRHGARRRRRRRCAAGGCVVGPVPTVWWPWRLPGRCRRALAAALAVVLDRIGVGLRDEEEARAEVAASLAPARATAKLLAGLPVFGLALGMSMGARPLGLPARQRARARLSGRRAAARRTRRRLGRAARRRRGGLSDVCRRRCGDGRSRGAGWPSSASDRRRIPRSATSARTSGTVHGRAGLVEDARRPRSRVRAWAAPSSGASRPDLPACS